MANSGGNWEAYLSTNHPDLYREYREELYVIRSHPIPGRNSLDDEFLCKSRWCKRAQELIDMNGLIEPLDIEVWNMGQEARARSTAAVA